jgi:hypothetical protein
MFSSWNISPGMVSGEAAGFIAAAAAESSPPVSKLSFLISSGGSG